MDILITRVKNGCRYFLRGGYPYLWLSALVFALYVKTLAFRFTDLDDYFLILDSRQHLHGVADVLLLFTSPVAKFFEQFYRPFLQLSFLLDGAAGGKNPFAYHLTNVLFHVTASCVVFTLLLRMRYARLFAFTAAAVFAVHPLLTQAVAWVPGRNDSLLAVFVLLSFLSLVRYREAPTAARYAFHQFFLLCALLTKETAVMAVPVFALYYLLVEKEPPRKQAALAAGWLAAALVWLALRTRAVGGTGLDLLRFSFTESAAAFIQYIGKAFFPVHLSPYPVLRDAAFVYGIAALVIAAVLLALSDGKRAGRIVFGSCWLLLFFLPSFVNQSVFYEHRAYLPLVGLFFIVPEMHGAARRLGAVRYLPLFGAGLIGCFFAVTFNYSDTFINRAVFAETAARLSPDFEGAFVNLGNYYNDIGDYPKAIEAYRRAQRINPAMAIAYFNAGEVYRKVGDYPDALREYRQAVAADPHFFDPRFIMGVVYMNTGKYREAAEQFDAAAAIDNNSEELRANRAILETRMRRGQGGRRK